MISGLGQKTKRPDRSALRYKLDSGLTYRICSSSTVAEGRRKDNKRQASAHRHSREAVVYQALRSSLRQAASGTADLRLNHDGSQTAC
jgi:hypothetical protein